MVGGKDYVMSTLGRRYQNATFYQSHSVDQFKMISYAIDMKPLIKNPNSSIKQFALSFIEDLKQEIDELVID